MRSVISSAIDRVLIDRQRPLVDLRIGERAQDLGERDGVLDRVGQHAVRAPALVARQPTPVQGGVDLDLTVAEDELDALAGRAPATA
jgi:hypothetical protein